MSPLTKRIALPLLAFAVAGLAFAAVASAHSLTKGKAQDAAQAYANKKVKDSDGDYVRAKAWTCDKKVPHKVGCKVGFHDKESLAAKPTNGGRNWACYEYLTMSYKAHDDDERPNYKVYYTRTATFDGSTNKDQGRGGC